MSLRPKTPGTPEPYFFEKYFPASYHITYRPPMEKQGPVNIPRDELERRSSITKDEFHVLLDVKDFKSDEISVKTCDETITIEAKQKKRPGVNVPRQFTRNYKLPPFFDSESVYTKYSENGILEILAAPSSTKKFRHLDELRAADTVNRR